MKRERKVAGRRQKKIAGDKKTIAGDKKIAGDKIIGNNIADNTAAKLRQLRGNISCDICLLPATLRALKNPICRTYRATYVVGRYIPW